MEDKYKGRRGKGQVGGKPDGREGGGGREERVSEWLLFLPSPIAL